MAASSIQEENGSWLMSADQATLQAVLQGSAIALTFVDLTEGARSELLDDLETAF